MKYDLFDLGMIISRDYLCWWVASWTISGNNLEKIRLWQDSNLCLPNTNWTLLPTEISQVGSKASLEDSSFPWLKWYLSWKILLTWISHLDSNFFFTDSNHSWKQLCYSQFRRKQSQDLCGQTANSYKDSSYWMTKRLFFFKVR